MFFSYVVATFWILHTSGTSQQDASNTSRRPLESPQIPIESAKESHARHPGVAVYLGFANNPFGPSTRLNNKKGKYNITEVFPTPHQILPGFESTENEVTAEFAEPRPKRGVLHLYNMVSCATGCNPLIYKGYGCYCGFLGSGYAVDGIDSCCKRHDWCYDNANCPMYLEYFVPYYWKCYHNKPFCAIEHGEWGGYDSCAQRLCECDRVLSECLSRYTCPSSRAICKSSPWRLLQNAFMLF